MKSKNIIFKIITVIVAVFWTFFALGLFCCYLQRKYFYPVRYKEAVFEIADSYGFDRRLIFAIINVESGFDENCESVKGAKGLMQITDVTADYIAEKLQYESYDIFDPDTNIRFGTYYLKYLFIKFKVLDTAVCAYNAGEGNVMEWLANADYSEDGMTLKKIPFSETSDYLKKVNKNYIKYQKLYCGKLEK